jgi:HEAT repeat protein/DNA-directed RNA polymerase subunit RPC12/RpoP
MISFACPKCDCDLEATEKQVGSKVACPECGTKLIVPGAAGKKSSGVTTQRPGPKAAPPPKTKPAPRRRQVEDEDDDEDVAPAKGKAAKGSSNNVLVLGICLGAAVVVLGGLGILYLVFRDQNAGGQPPIVMAPPVGQGFIPPGDPPPNPNQPIIPVPPVAPAPGAPKADEEKKAAEDKTVAAKPPAPEKEDIPDFAAKTSAADSGQKVYQRLLKSTVLIYELKKIGSGDAYQLHSQGSGTLIDKKNRLILTNDHVAGKADLLLVFFATYDKNGKLIQEKEFFFKQVNEVKGRTAIPGHTVITDPKRDLALVQLERLPDSAESLPLFDSQANVGQEVYSVGHPGAGQGLWVFTPGTVRSLVRKMKFPNLIENVRVDREVDTLITNSPTNPGDSGGPLVNSRAEVVAVVQGIDTSGRGMSLFVDIGEARGLLDDYTKKSGTKVVLAESAGLTSSGQTTDIPTLTRYLSHKNPKVRATAVQALGDAGPAAKVAIGELTKSLTDSDDFVRRMAIESLSRIGPPDRSDLPMLVSKLKDPSKEVRNYAATILGRMGPSAQSASSDLLQTLKDSEPVVRQSAARSLGKFGASDKDKITAALKDALKDDDKDTRIAVAEGLTGIRPLTALDVPRLLEIVKQKDPEVRVIAMRTLGELKADARGAVPALIEVLKDNDSQVRRAALDCLGLIGSESREALPMIEKSLKDPDKDVRRGAIEAIGKVGSDAKSVVPALVEALKDPDTKRSAIIALGHIGPPAKDAVKEFAFILAETTDRGLRLDVVTALATIRPTGGEAQKVAPELVKLLEERDNAKDLWEKTVEALGKMGGSAVRDLDKTLRTGPPPARLGAARALGEIGPAARAAIPSLKLIFDQDTNAEVKQACDLAARRILR